MYAPVPTPVPLHGLAQGLSAGAVVSSLQLGYPDKYRLWSELLKANTDRIFIESVQPPRLGERVPVELLVEGVQLVATGDVVGLRRAGPRFRAGVWVRFNDEEL